MSASLAIRSNEQFARSGPTPGPCHVCGNQATELVYRSAASRSLTSLSEVIPQRVEVSWCNGCGHLSTPSLTGLDEYYNSGYRMMVESEEEDQLLEVQAGHSVFRCEYQAATLLERVPIPRKARVLDYGCGKSSTLRRLKRLRPDLNLHLFDVSSTYLPFWREFVAEDCWATHETPEAWAESFDLVTSFYSLEHASRPREFAQQVWSLLKPGGWVYGIVPNVYANPADLLVADHTNHFSRASMHALLSSAGFSSIQVDADLHPSALVFTAKRPDAPSFLTELTWNRNALRKEALKIGSYWQEFEQGVRGFEQANEGLAAIYGSGFYGATVWSCLQHPERIRCFIDRNPHRQGKQCFGLPIVASDAIDPDIRTVYIAVNPLQCEAVEQSLQCLYGDCQTYWRPSHV